MYRPGPAVVLFTGDETRRIFADAPKVIAKRVDTAMIRPRPKSVCSVCCGRYRFGKFAEHVRAKWKDGQHHRYVRIRVDMKGDATYGY